ncbi:MAG: DUF2092 domain-containing protein [Candidatus Omnitrophota bacterium]|jgi:hypothetical protein|nr:MAG: DUF2092 domain-containing protein [Candidatus Omnitrophota bacterium]
MPQKPGKTTIFILLLAVAVLPLFAEENHAPSIDPKIEELVKTASYYFKKLNNFGVDISMVIKVEAENMNQQMTSGQSLALRRPDNVALVRKSGMLGGDIICDGTNVYHYVPLSKTYTVTKAPATLNELKLTPGGGMEMMMAAPSAMVLEFFIRDDSAENILIGVNEARYVALEEMNGETYHHMKFIKDEVDMDIWMKEGETPLLHKIKPDIAKSFEKMGSRMPLPIKNMKVEMELTFTNWQIDVDFPDSVFTFTPPPDARQTDAADSQNPIPN